MQDAGSSALSIRNILIQIRGYGCQEHGFEYRPLVNISRLNLQTHAMLIGENAVHDRVIGKAGTIPQGTYQLWHVIEPNFSIPVILPLNTPIDYTDCEIRNQMAQFLVILYPRLSLEGDHRDCSRLTSLISNTYTLYKRDYPESLKITLQRLTTAFLVQVYHMQIADNLKKELEQCIADSYMKYLTQDDFSSIRTEALTIYGREIGALPELTGEDIRDAARRLRKEFPTADEVQKRLINKMKQQELEKEARTYKKRRTICCALLCLAGSALFAVCAMCGVFGSQKHDNSVAL
jgi:hypothetical protein